MHSINLYRNGYANALNTFKRIKVEVSPNEDFSDANALFGTADVEETAATKLAAQTINLTTPVTARYVRIWQKGEGPLHPEHELLMEGIRQRRGLA